MTNSLSDLLKLTQQQLNAIHKTDIIDILEKSDSTEGSFETLIDSISRYCKWSQCRLTCVVYMMVCRHNTSTEYKNAINQ